LNLLVIHTLNILNKCCENCEDFSGVTLKKGSNEILICYKNKMNLREVTKNHTFSKVKFTTGNGDVKVWHMG
jgi:hypothetical protein